MNLQSPRFRYVVLGAAGLASVFFGKDFVFALVNVLSAYSTPPA